MKRSLASAPWRRTRGFSLIEMVAAFLIFALGVGILMQVLAASLRNTRQSADYTMAALWAQSLLDTVGVGQLLEPGTSNGRFDATYAWQLDIHQVDPDSVLPAADASGGTGVTGRPVDAAGNPRFTSGAGNAGAIQNAPFDLYQIDLTVTWPGGTARAPHAAHFGTLRAVNPQTDGLQQAGIPVQPPLARQAGRR